MRDGSFCITRQITLDGIFYVELETGGFDFTSPGMLAGKRYPGEGCHADPRDAAKALISVRDAWQAARARVLYTPDRLESEDDQRIILTSIGTTGGGLVDHSPSELTDEGIIAWGERTYEKLPKCDKCGDIIDGKPVKLTDDPDAGDFCSASCAEWTWEQNERDNQTVVIESRDNWEWWNQDDQDWVEDPDDATHYARMELEPNDERGEIVTLDEAQDSFERYVMADMPDPPTPL